MPPHSSPRRERRASRREWAARRVDDGLQDTTGLSPASLFGLAFDSITERQVLDRIFASLDWGRGGWVVTCNLEILRQFTVNPELRPVFAEADMIVADGMPVVWASRLARDPVPERVAGSSLIFPLCGMAALGRRSVFFLGGNPGTADAAASVLSRRYPGLEIAGTLCPPFGFEAEPDEIERIRDALHAAKPDIVLVCLGAPKQEHLIRFLRRDLPGAWFFGLGISFGFVSGEVRRAPLRIQNLGLEWVHRMVQEPGRLTRRYIVDGLPFAGRLALYALGRRVRSRPR
ncbi:MAG: WecB/TagA/CpsF family glycosyltransferase [Solirubrobacteraceae bacterium]|nr:WecB/TagA/CpsF family glycosyltransferase [Solirubrobacteraceae bacterium]